MKTLVTFALLLILSQVYSQNIIKVGDKVKLPFNNITFVGDSPKESPKGKFLILEFWATWCVPCVQQIPHLNELSKKYSSDKVWFISSTNESNEIIKKFIQKFPIETYLVSDKEAVLTEMLDVMSIPLTLLIDDKGILRWKGNPGELTHNIIEKFLHGENLNEIMPLQNENLIEMEDEELGEIDIIKKYRYLLKDPKLCYYSKIYFKNYSISSQSTSTDSLSIPIVFTSLKLKKILSQIPEFKNHNIILAPELSDKNANVYYKDCSTDPIDTKWKRYSDSLKSQLLIDWKQEVENKEVFYLRVVDASKIEYVEKLENSEKQFSSIGQSNGMLIYKNYSPQAFLESLATFYDGIFIDDTHITEKINIIVEYSSLEKLKEYLDKYGFAIESVSQPVNTLNVYSTEKEKL